MDLSSLVFLDVEADRAGRVLAIGAVRGERSVLIEVPVRGERRAREALESFVGESPIAGHNVSSFDLPLLARPPVSWAADSRPVLDTLILSELADPARPSHALEKAGRVPGALPDPVRDAREARDRALGACAALRGLEPGTAAFYADLLASAGHGALAALVAREAGNDAWERGRASVEQLPDLLLSRLCRVRLAQVLESVETGIPAERLALALAARFIEVTGQGGAVAFPPSPALASIPRFSEILTRLMGPLCPDHACAHRKACDVHRPFAEEILARNFELPGFRPGQGAIVHAVLGGFSPLAILPTGGGKSLCYQLPAVHGAERLRGLTVIVSPLQALMADQVGSLSQKYTATCFVNSQLTMAERQENLAGLRSGKYNIVYLGPEQLRNPSMLRLLRNRPPFLWVIDEAHCISQWGHSFRTDYTYLPRAIASIHGLTVKTSLPPLLALFTATATREVRADIAAQIAEGLGVTVSEMDYGAKRENLSYEVIVAENMQQKDDALENLLAAHPDGARLVYCATVRTAREVAETLRARGIPTALYHGRLAPREKTEELSRFLGGTARTVVATSAFGMGIDKPDIRLVVHYDLPGSLEDYVQETGRAGRDGAPARCVLLYCEADLETQFYLKTSAHVSARDVRFVFQALRARARRFGRPREDGKTELWVVAEELFAEEHLELELDWEREELPNKLKLALYHLEADGVLERRENRTRAFGVFPALASLELAEQALPPDASPATRRVLRFLYDPERPRRVSILDIADDAGITPSEAFRELQSLTRLGVVKHDLAFEVTLSRGATPSSKDIAARHFDALKALFALGSDLDDAPVLHLRSAAVEIGRTLGRAVLPHELFHALRALRQQGLLRLDKVQPGRYAVRFEPSFARVSSELAALRATAESLLEYLERGLGDRRGRDVRAELDVERFLAESPDLFQRRTADEVVSACLLLHRLGAWHLADPPVVLEMAMRVAVDARASLTRLDASRPKKKLEHDVMLVHLLREYACLPADRRAAYVDDYFEQPRDDLLARYFPRRRRALARPVSPVVEKELVTGLTGAQLDAVTAEDRALLVVAGPGSGKTHTVVRRIAHMVRARQIRPEEILVLAFNRAAVAELRQRLETELEQRASRVDVRTFHSLALRITGADLRDDARDSEQVLDAALVRAADLLGGVRLSPEPDQAPPDPAELEELRLQVLGPVRHVIVDEYQDLDPEQYRLLAALVGLDRASAKDRTQRSVYVVGDDDQAVYGFRSASVEFLRRFEEEFGARRICLTQNFRSSAPIVEAASGFVAKIPGRMKVTAEEQVRPAEGADPGDEMSVRRFRYGSMEELSAHASFVIQKSLHRSGARSIAVLARNWGALDDVRCLLEQGGIPVVLHHRDYHRAIHRRQPAFRIIRHLWDTEANIEGSGPAYLRHLLETFRRSPEEPPAAALIAFAEEIDRERGRQGAVIAPMSARELADELLLASRDAALRDRAVHDSGAVHLCTFHGSKGLEFDKVIVLPARLRDRMSLTEIDEEKRAFYVAITRARRELVLTTVGAPGELALEVPAAGQDLRGVIGRLPHANAGYLDCDPADVVLTSTDLASAQGVISRLREGDDLEIDEARPDRPLRLVSHGRVVSVLSKAGQSKLDALTRRLGRTLRARVHEIYVHGVRDKDGNVTRRWLVTLPAIRGGG